MNASLVSGLRWPVRHCRVWIGPVCHECYYTGTIGEYTTSGATVNASLVSGLNAPFGIAIAPVPEPSTIAGLITAALTAGGIGFFSWRRHRKRALAARCDGCWE